jgi:predicted cupin superfamily sugar epimerase
MTVDFLVQQFKMLPHPEGGYYKETYRSNVTTYFDELQGKRNNSTGIYFLIEKNNFSAFHKIKSDEMWHFYCGDTLEVIELHQNGELIKTRIGNNLKEGETFQYTVKSNTWFASRVFQNGQFSFVGCTVCPGFDFADFELADQKLLMEQFPQHAMIIKELTR